MYEYLNENVNTPVVGSFLTDNNEDFKNGYKTLYENFIGSYNMNPVQELSKILSVDALKESYKEGLLGDVLCESIDDPYYAHLPEKMEQLFENTSMEIVNESMIANLAPIVGITPPIMKKNYLEGVLKDIMMTEVPTSPIIKRAFERKFLKDKQGKKYYIPEIFYDDGDHKEVLSKAKGKPISSKWYPEATDLPMMDLDILGESGGSIETRDTLGYNFCIESVKMEVAVSTLVEVPVNKQPDFGSNNNITIRVSTVHEEEVVEDILFATVDFYHGKVSVSSAMGKIKKVKFGGNLSNENNTESIELDREREIVEWKIGDGARINTGLTIEKIKDYKALANINITSELITDMSEVLTQFEDKEGLSFLDDSLERWRNKTSLPFGYTKGFVDTSEFDCVAPASKMVTDSQWIDTELKFRLSRTIDRLKTKLNNKKLMFVLYGNPENITLLQDTVKWVVDEDTKIGGIQLDYKFGILTASKDRVHVISTLKVPASKGIRILGYPLSDEIITFKHYKYSLNIENIYRNPLTPLTPNLMGTSRHLTTELLPLQGEIKLKNSHVGIQ